MPESNFAPGGSRNGSAYRTSIGDLRTKDRRTLRYGIFFNGDESEAIVFERYRDAESAIQHFANIAHLMERLMATASVTGEVLGTANSKMKEQMGRGDPRLFTPWFAVESKELTSMN